MAESVVMMKANTSCNGDEELKGYPRMEMIKLSHAKRQAACEMQNCNWCDGQLKTICSRENFWNQTIVSQGKGLFVRHKSLAAKLDSWVLSTLGSWVIGTYVSPCRKLSPLIYLRIFSCSLLILLIILSQSQHIPLKEHNADVVLKTLKMQSIN